MDNDKEAILDRLSIIVDRLAKPSKYSAKRRRKRYKKLAQKQIKYLRQ